MRIINEYLSAKVKLSKIKATNDTISKIVYDEIMRLGADADLNHIDVSGCTSLKSAFANTKFNGDISKWNLSKVTDTKFMFYNCHRFNGDLSEWDMSNVTDAKGMFDYCIKFNKPLEMWDVSNVEDMFKMFYNCRKFNQPLAKWKPDKVKSIAYMFSNCLDFNQDLSSWNFKNKQVSKANAFSACPIDQKYMPIF